MKAILCNLEKQQKEMYAQIGKRYATYKNRSDEWRESEEGRLYKSQTTILDDIYAVLSSGIVGLENLAGGIVK